MRPRTYALSIPLIGVLVAALLAGCAGDPDRGGCDISSTGSAGDAISLVATFTPARLDAGSLVTSADGTYVVASCTGGICRWNAGGGAYETISDRGYDAISPDLSLVARKVGCADVALVEVDGGTEVQRLEGLPDPKITDVSPVGEIAFSPDGRLVAGAGLQGDLVIWSTEDGDEMTRTDLGTGVGSISFSPDSKQVAVSADDSISILDAGSGDEVGTISAASGTGPAWSPDGRWIAGVTTEGSPTVWDAKTFKTVETFNGFDAASVAFSPNSRSLAATSEGGDGPKGDEARLALWTPTALGGSGETRDVSKSVAPGSNVVFRPDGKVLYTATAEDGLAAWDLRTGKPASPFQAPGLSTTSTG
ncbi:MAG: WD40 repeat domain-containing protein [Nocardioides sp.]|uniref:WD40 repeat domain-containing protein n=1 Tax=Nocardioides sp. TaxID=35761 RepID=UPI003D6C2009